jgi:molybdenum cofactor cytidylyltransferase
VKIAGIILAAGSSSRFEDGHKLLAEIDGVPIVRHACTGLAASEIADIVLVTPDVGGAVAMAAGLGRWQTVGNPDAPQGLSTSLRTGLENIPQDSDGVLVALADMPGIAPVVVNALISAFAESKTKIVFPVSADDRRGHPIIWPRSLFLELDTVTGDTGGKTVLSDHKDLWHPVTCQSEGAFVDIDTRADLEEYCGWLTTR